MTLLELLNLMKKHLKFIAALPIACAVLMGAYSFIGMPNTYDASTSVYVLASQEQNGGNLSTTLSSSQLVANDVATLLNSDRVKKQAAEDLNLDNLGDFEIAIAGQTTSRIIDITVTGADPAKAAEVANALADNAVKVTKDVMGVDAVSIIEPAATPKAPSGPSRMLYTAVAFMGGLFAAVAVVVVADMLNTRVRSSEDVEELLGIPVIGRVPAVKGGN